MSPYARAFLAFSLIMLLATLVFGVLAGLAFVYPELGAWLPFVQLRPMHVSAALFWIFGAATAGIIHVKQQVFGAHAESRPLRAFMVLWMITTLAVFVFYALHRFGGREYWEFPPWLCVPLLLAWLLWMADYFRAWSRRPKDPPIYVWMWTTGIVFFLVTFLEQNLYHIPWFRDTFLREITVQWKSNGAMVGAWNQMIYGLAMYLMVRISGDESLARGPKAFFFWFLGLSNLMFNWGHHLYPVPSAGWMRHVAYAISMTEFVFFLSIVQGFRNKLAEHRRFKHLLTYRFLVASEAWVFLNLALVLCMSVPAINRYTHGTHITVAHSMGATIGINTMILMAALGHVLGIDELERRGRGRVMAGLNITTVSLAVFWLALIVAGAVKGYREVALGIDVFQELMAPVIDVLKVFVVAGFGLLIGLGMLAGIYLFILLKGPGGTAAVQAPATRPDRRPRNMPASNVSTPAGSRTEAQNRVT